MIKKINIAIFISMVIILSMMLTSCEKDEDINNFLIKENIAITIVANPNLMFVTVDNRVVIRGRIELSDEEIYYIPNPTIINNMTGVYALSQNVTYSDKQYIIKIDGTVWEMQNEKPSETNDFVFRQMEGIYDCVKICGGGGNTIALLSDGSVLMWGWGLNEYGQLENEKTTDNELPKKVEHLPKITDIFAGNGYCLAVGSDKNLYFWELKNSGTDIKKPKKLKNIGEVRQIDGNKLLLKDGTVWESSKLPTKSFKKIKELKNITMISSVGVLLALTEEGSVWQDGALPGTWVDYQPKQPMKMVEGLPKVVAIAGGTRTRVAIAEDGSVWMWDLDVSIDVGVGYKWYSEDEVECIISAEDIKGIEVKLYSAEN